MRKSDLRKLSGCVLVGAVLSLLDEAVTQRVINIIDLLLAHLKQLGALEGKDMLTKIEVRKFNYNSTQ